MKTGMAVGSESWGIGVERKGIVGMIMGVLRGKRGKFTVNGFFIDGVIGNRRVRVSMRKGSIDRVDGRGRKTLTVKIT